MQTVGVGGGGSGGHFSSMQHRCKDENKRRYKDHNQDKDKTERCMRKMGLYVELTHASGSEVVGFLCSISYLSKKRITATNLRLLLRTGKILNKTQPD
jgi:hypothetical protein